VTLRSVKVAGSWPVGLSGVAFLYGYLRSAARREPRVDDPAFRRLVRRELRGRLLPSRLLAAAGGERSDPAEALVSSSGLK
jgi:hypothetical protein